MNWNGLFAAIERAAGMVLATMPALADCKKDLRCIMTRSVIEIRKNPQHRKLSFSRDAERLMHPCMRRWAIFYFVLAAGCFAKPPELKHVYPSGGFPGTNTLVAVGGTLEPWPVSFWSDHPGITVVAGEKKKTASIEVAASVPDGRWLIAAKNAEGVSAPRWFRVSRLPPTVEVEPNNVLSSAPVVTNFPTLLHGRLEKAGDIDHVQLSLDQGESISARVLAYGMDSPVDPMLHLFTAGGKRVAFNHDAFHLDPWLVYTAEEAGAFILQLSGFKNPPAADVRLMGSEDTVYQLALKKERVIPVRPFPEMKGRAVRAALIEKEMRFPFEAVKGDKIQFRIHAVSLGFAFDPVLSIVDAAGKEVKRADDQKDKKLDPLLDWTANADGVFHAVVTDLYQRSGADLKFQLDMKDVFPTFEVSCEAFSVGIETGKTATLSLTCDRLFGETNEVMIVAEGLPPGVTASIPLMPAKSGAIDVIFRAADDCLAIQKEVALYAVTRGEALVRKKAVRVKLKGVGTPHEHLMHAERDAIWLTVF